MAIELPLRAELAALAARWEAEGLRRLHLSTHYSEREDDLLIIERSTGKALLHCAQALREALARASVSG